MLHQRLKILFEKYKNSTASEEERAEFMDLVLLKENEEALRALLNESMQTENENQLSTASTSAILGNIFDIGKKNDIEIRRATRRRMLMAVTSIAAMVILLLGTGIYLTSEKKQQVLALPAIRKSKAMKKDILPGTKQAVLTLGNGKQVYLDSTANGHIAAQQGMALVNIHGSLTYQNDGIIESKVEYNTVTVPRKGQYHLILSDGTKVWLNASSSLRFPAAFAGKERIVELTGEGYFEVAKDAAKPFHVQVKGTDVQALGTHFNIMAYDNETALQATLLEGSIKVKHNNDSRVLKPGEEALIAGNNQKFDVIDADVDEVIAWKNGVFLFNRKTPLPSVMRQMERWYDINVHYEGAVPNQNFGGGIQRSLTLTQALSSLQESGIKFKINGNELTVRGE